jgi:hypothetical protein
MPPHKNSKSPTSLTLRTYQVGFGDCFLLTFRYPDGNDKNILIDFGSNAQPKSAPKDLMPAIANDIASECKGKLHAVVLTHRHKDHIKGFATSKGKGSGDIIAGLKPDLVIQPWTEDPKASKNARTATSLHLTPNEQFAVSLEYMHEISAGIEAEARHLAQDEALASRSAFYVNLAMLGEEGIKNKSAVDNLARMAARPGASAEYVNHGYQSKLATILPGVTVTVLGPPDLDQSDAIKKERSADANEFWMLQSNVGRYVAAVSARRASSARESDQKTQALFPNAKRHSGDAPPQYARWLIQKLRAIRGGALLDIVRILDDAMNNTSVILLFEVNGNALLFPGDAQIENWQYTLDKLDKDAALKKRLANVSVYKVGHHGSRNATPKTLWANFARRGAPSKKGRLRTFVSTMANVYGKTEATAVPRATLVRALKSDSTFFSTQSITGDIKHTEEIDLT